LSSSKAPRGRNIAAGDSAEMIKRLEILNDFSRNFFCEVVVKSDQFTSSTLLPSLHQTFPRPCGAEKQQCCLLME
jgi:hypothetical protein